MPVYADGAKYANSEYALWHIEDFELKVFEKKPLQEGL